MNKKSKKYKVVCAECGKVEYVTECRYKHYKTCSLTCMGKYNSKRYIDILPPLK